jgi:signal transduction histidine kinase
MSVVSAGSSKSKREPEDKSGESWLVDCGEMGKLILSMNWIDTPLGPIDRWRPSLRSAIKLCLASNIPISLVWGAEYVQLYNDAYRPICGAKHPESMGQHLIDSWASAYPVFEEPFMRALAGEATSLENQRMFLDRNGYLEETYFTFSFSPIRDETGIAGLFNPVIETTDLILGARRTRALRDVAAPKDRAQTMEAACILAAQTLSEHSSDLPFVLFYLVDDEEKQARLVASTGLPTGHPASPLVVGLALSQSTWPLAEAIDCSRGKHVKDLETRFGHFCCGEYPEGQKQAMILPMVLPIKPSVGKGLIGFVVAGVSTRLALNERYAGYYELLVTAIHHEVANARVHQMEMERLNALAAMDRAKTAFFSSISHEFRTPLTLVLGSLETELNECNQSDVARERLETAQRNSMRLLKLVNTLLDFACIDAGQGSADYEPVNLAAFTAELASMFRSVIEKAGLLLVIDCPPLPQPIQVDRSMWEKIVLNLLSNAFKHTFQGTITVTLRWRDTHVELLVTDTGAGIPATELPFLFQLFHRVRGAKSRSHEGTGIGLVVVRELVALHGGTIGVESQEGQGSTFAVTVRTGTHHLPPAGLPGSRAMVERVGQAAAFVAEAADWLPNATVRQKSAPAAGPIDRLGRRKAIPALGTRKGRILLADDNTDMRDYLERLLGESYEVVAVSDGSKALAAALESAPDLVLTDIMMPGLDGISLLRTLKSNPQTRMIPVVLLSARADEESAIEGLNAGAHDYLAKPFSARELLARLRSYLEPGRMRGEWAERLEQSNLDLESFNYSVSHDLRAPLRAIDGFSKMLLDECGGKLDPQAVHHLHRIRVGTQKMSTIIDDLLTLSSVKGQAPRREQIHLSAIARDVLEELAVFDPARKVAVAIEDGLTACADERLVKIVLVNLLGNAWKYTTRRADARICLGRQMQGGETVFFVRDNGAGFDMSRADQLFTPFHRLHRDSEFEGTGIGLATVQRVIARHGGRIWAEAAVGAGATFYFTLEGSQT